MDEETRRKLEETAKKEKDRRSAEEAAKMEAEKEKVMADKKLAQEKEVILTKINEELKEFNQYLLPLKHTMVDPKPFYRMGNDRFTILATEHKTIEISVTGSSKLLRMNINDLADRPEFRGQILDILTGFLRELEVFEKYYVDKVDKYKKT
jgi:hypothetical protein